MSKVKVILTFTSGDFEVIDELVITDEKLTDGELHRAVTEVLDRNFAVES